MPRKRIDQSDSYEKTFPKRLRELMRERGIPQQPLADYLGKSRQAVSYYCDGTSAPSWEDIAKIARYFSVSSDYLLGLTDDPAPKPSAVNELGLSPKAVQYLLALRENSKISPYDTRFSLLSDLLENSVFDTLLAQCVRYIELKGTVYNLNFLKSAEYTRCADTLNEHGFVITAPDEQANAVFSERVTNLLRMILDKRAEKEFDHAINKIEDQ